MSHDSVRAIAGCALLLILTSGCGDGATKLAVARASGRVVCDGQPVANASVLFNPNAAGKTALVGKQAYGNTDENGEFTLSTYGKHDGAVIGKHSVIVAMDADATCNCVAVDTREVTQVEITPGIENSVEISLPLKTGNERPVRKSSSDDD